MGVSHSWFSGRAMCVVKLIDVKSANPEQLLWGYNKIPLAEPDH